MDDAQNLQLYVAGSKVAVFLGEVIRLSIRESLQWGYINPYYEVHDHPLTQGTTGSLDASTYGDPSLLERKTPPPCDLHVYFSWAFVEASWAQRLLRQVMAPNQKGHSSSRTAKRARLLE